MGDGWETARRRGPGHDWVIFALGQPGKVEEIEYGHGRTGPRQSLGSDGLRKQAGRNKAGRYDTDGASHEGASFTVKSLDQFLDFLEFGSPCAAQPFKLNRFGSPKRRKISFRSF